MTERTILRSTLDGTGWICPDCGWDLDRAGAPNAPEIGACRNPECGLIVTATEG